MYQCTGYFLLAFDTQQRLQDSTQRPVVVGDILCKFFVQLHWQDAHGLVARLEPQRGIDDFTPSYTASFGQDTGLNDRVPLLYKLPTGDAGYGDADQS